MFVQFEELGEDVSEWLKASARLLGTLGKYVAGGAPSGGGGVLRRERTEGRGGLPRGEPRGARRVRAGCRNHELSVLGPAKHRKTESDVAMWDEETIPWAVYAMVTFVLAMASHWNLRCPKCHAAMTAHESPGGIVGLFFTPRQECPRCSTRTPLRTPHSPSLWWSLWIVASLVLAVFLLRRSGLASSFWHWFVG